MNHEERRCANCAFVCSRYGQNGWFYKCVRKKAGGPPVNDKDFCGKHQTIEEYELRRTPIIIAPNEERKGHY